MFLLECRKWGFKKWGFKQIRGYPKKKAFFLRFLDFPGAVRALRKRAKKAEKGRKSPISADFRDGRPDTPLNPHLLHPHLRHPNFEAFKLVSANTLLLKDYDRLQGFHPLSLCSLKRKIQYIDLPCPLVTQIL